MCTLFNPYPTPRMKANRIAKATGLFTLLAASAVTFLVLSNPFTLGAFSICLTITCFSMRIVKPIALAYFREKRKKEQIFAEGEPDNLSDFSESNRFGCFYCPT